MRWSEGGRWSEEAEGRGNFETQLGEAGTPRGARAAHILKVRSVSHANREWALVKDGLASVDRAPLVRLIQRPV